MGQKRSAKEPFAEDGWGARVRNWVKTAERLNDLDWNAIVDDVSARSGGALERDSTGGSEGSMGASAVVVVDPRVSLEL